MNARIKFHIMAVTLIVLAVIITYKLTEPPQSSVKTKTVVVSQYPLTITRATWGENCNERIRQLLQRKSKARVKARPFMPGKNAAENQLAIVKKNNVIDKLRELCEGKSECSFTANAKTLGEPLDGCPKSLELYYYCSEIARVQKRTFRQGKKVALECRPRRVR